MYKLYCLLLSFVICTSIIAQHTLPSIKASSTKVDVRIDQAYMYKGEWILEPDKKPDILRVENKWPYDTKKVTFITDIDSVTVDVQPGHTYDFIILLNDNIPCYIQIAAVPNPILLGKKYIIPVLAGFVLIFGLLVWNRRRLNNQWLLWCGYAVAVLFWAMTFISGQLHGKYNHSKNVISELGAIGTKSELFTSFFLLALSLLGILFSIGFYRMSKRVKLSVVPAVLSFTMPFTMVWAGIFPLGNEWHGATGPLPLLLIIASLLLYLLWKKNPELTALRKASLISFIIMLLILTRFIRPFGNEYEGLVQRFFYLGWSLWTLAISYYLSKQIKTL